VFVPTNLTPKKIEESFASPDTMSFWQLPSFIELLEASGFSAQRHRLYFDSLLARPFLLCAMVLVAAIFSLRMQRRGGTTLMIVGGVFAGFMLYFISEMVFTLGLSATIPVALAAWTPAGISTLLGTTFLLHLEDG
jgi:lipopolysaccharide export system permease protein